MAAGKEKLVGTDTGMDVIIKMSDGNPGALQIIAGMMSTGQVEEIDPDNEEILEAVVTDFKADQEELRRRGEEILNADNAQ